MQSLSGIAAVVGPLVFGLIFAWSIRQNATLHAPGLAIYVAGSLLALAFCLALWVGRRPRTAAAAA
jgi:DHA1 family tetracycline resistance protein-like MFS transporter